MKQRFDEKANPQDFEPGDLVWIYFMEIMVGGSRKFLNRYSGPYILLEKVNPVAFTVAHAHNNKRLKNIVHVNRMKRFHHRTVAPMAIEDLTHVEVDAHDVDDLNPLDRTIAEVPEVAPVVDVDLPAGINYADLLNEAPTIEREQNVNENEDDREMPQLEPVPPIPDITDGDLEPPLLTREG